MRLQLWTYPSSYFGATWEDYYVYLGQHRHSDSVTRSNFTRAKELLEDLPDDPPDEDKTSRFVVAENHWAVGWVEWIAIHKDDQTAIDHCEEMLESLENYPLIDDEHHSMLEWNEASDYWGRLPLAERIELAIKYGHSMFAARSEDPPADWWDSGLYEDLRSE